MSKRQYVACRFRPTDRRAFTYHNDGEPVSVGDVVKVPDRSGDGWQRVTVSAIMDAKPDFETKGIIGKADADSETPEPQLI